jgi:hypothetical protein
MKAKRYYGEEAQRVTLKDCQAAHMTIAKLRAGQIDFSDIMVEAPKCVTAVLVEEKR